MVLLFLAVAGMSWANDFKTLPGQHMLIHFTDKDSGNARIARQTLGQYYHELVFDLQLQVPDTIQVYIIPTRGMFRDIIRGRLPEWTGAFATPGDNAMYLKSPTWDRENDFKTTLVHELLHLLLHKKMGNIEIPRWLDEGLAIFYSQDQRWITSTALSKALTTRSVIHLADIDRVLNFHRTKAELAYQESWSAVQYLLATYDIDALQIILNNLQQRHSLDQAFRQATGSPFQEFEREWIRYAKKKYEWIWLYELDNYVWILIIILFIAAFILIRFRNHKKIKEWEEEPLPDPEDTGPETEAE